MSKRRLNGEGTITWHKGNKAWLVSLYSAERGTRDTRYAKKFREAQQKLRGLQRNREDGVQLVTPRGRLKTDLQEWLKLKRPSLRESTYDGYALMVNRYLIPRFGHIKLKDLSPEQINDTWIRMKAEGISDSIIEHCHSRLATFLIYAVQRKFRIDNPMTFVSKPKAEAKTGRAFSEEETAAILDTAKSEFNGDYHAIIHTALHTGMRRNELLALTWGDVDVVLGEINVTKSIDRRRGKTTINPPKTPTGTRLVTLPPESSIVLRKHKEQQKLNALLHGYTVDDNTNVFIRLSSPKGEVLKPRAVSNGFKVIAERAGYPDLNYHFHETRHTHATLMLFGKDKVDPMIVQVRLGHKDIGTTMNIYSHPSTSIQREASDKFQIAVKPVST
jgi:integrase